MNVTQLPEVTTQLQKLYDMESILFVRIKAVEADTAKVADLAAQLLACITEQNVLLGLHK